MFGKISEDEKEEATQRPPIGVIEYVFRGFHKEYFDNRQFNRKISVKNTLK